MPCPSYISDLRALTILGEEQNLLSSSLCNFLLPPVTPSLSLSLSGQDILLSMLLSDTLNLYTSLRDRNKVSHPYKRRAKIIVSNLKFRLRDRTLKCERFSNKWNRFPNSNCS
jgi:hypothetical protein